MFSTNTNKYKLFNEDALSLLSRLPNNSIDLILTDPHTILLRILLVTSNSLMEKQLIMTLQNGINIL